MISKERMAEFKALYRKKYGVELDDEAAREMAERFLAMFKVVYRPIPQPPSS